MVRLSRQHIPEILSRQPLFRGLDPEELGWLAAGTSIQRLKKNEVLFQKGDNPKGLHVVVQGQLKLLIPTPQGWDKIVHMELAGASFGEAVVFLDKPYPVSAVATQDSIILMLDKATVHHAIDSSPVLCRKMLASMSVRLHELLADMEVCTLRSSTQRLICFLIQQAPADDNRYDVNLGDSKQTLASQLNLAPETLSRVLATLSNAELIAVKGRRITVLDRSSLQAYNG